MPPSRRPQYGSVLVSRTLWFSSKPHFHVHNYIMAGVTEPRQRCGSARGLVLTRIKKRHSWDYIGRRYFWGETRGLLRENFTVLYTSNVGYRSTVQYLNHCQPFSTYLFPISSIVIVREGVVVILGVLAFCILSSS